jgi:membrane-associated phospholipid phosphatase
VIALKDRSRKPIKEINIPDLQVPDIFKKIIDWSSHVKHFYWIIILVIILAAVSMQMPYIFWAKLWFAVKANTALVILLMFFSLITVSVTWNEGQKADEWIFLLLNSRGIRPPLLDCLMLGLTQLGHFVFALILALIFYFTQSKYFAYSLIFGVITLGLMIEIIKLWIRRVRPYIKLKKIRIVGSRASGRSFPSGHTGQAFFLASLIVHYYHVNIYLWIFLYATALLVGITRIYVGMHYPRDVIAGAILGTAWGIIGVMVNGYILYPNQ